MSIFSARQIKKILAAPIRFEGLGVTTSATIVTTQISFVLSTAGFGGAAVSLTVSASEADAGVITSGANNRTEVYLNSTKKKFDDGAGNEVYGRITELGGVYTLTLYSLVAGVETTYAPGSKTIDFEFDYRFEFKDLPSDAIITITTRNINQDPGGAAGKLFSESLTITGTNTISSLTKLPDVNSNVKLIVNGKVESTLGVGPSFTMAGTNVSWNATNAGYILETTDKAVVFYTTLQ